jgi:hypothetical protein
MHAVPLHVPPTPQADPAGANVQVLPEQIWHVPQSASVQQDPAGKHFLPHFTFGDLHRFRRFFASPSASPTPPATAINAPPSTARLDPARARIMTSNR